MFFYTEQDDMLLMLDDLQTYIIQTYLRTPLCHVPAAESGFSIRRLR